MTNQATVTPEPGETNQLSPEEQEAANFAATLESTLAGIKREDGTQKFENANTALESIKPKDDHIKDLETQVATLKADLERAGTQEEILAKFIGNKTPVEAPKPEATQLDPDTVKTMLTELIDTRDANAKSDANVKKVAQELTKVYGDKAPDIISSIATKMNITEDFLKEVIAKSPEAAFEILGLTKAEGAAPANLSGSHNTEGFNKAAPTKPKSVLGDMFITENEVKDCWDGCHPDKYME